MYVDNYQNIRLHENFGQRLCDFVQGTVFWLDLDIELAQSA